MALGVEAFEPFVGLGVEALGEDVVALLVVAVGHAVLRRVELLGVVLVGLLEAQRDPAPLEVDVDDLHHGVVTNGHDLVGHLDVALSHVEVPDQVVAVGDDAMVKVIDIDLERRRISLSLKQADEDYTEEFDPSKYGMADSYDEQGNYIFPEGFDAEPNDGSKASTPSATSGRPATPRPSAGTRSFRPDGEVRGRRGRRGCPAVLVERLLALGGADRRFARERRPAGALREKLAGRAPNRSSGPLDHSFAE